METSSTLAEAPNPAARSRWPRFTSVFFAITFLATIIGGAWLYPFWQQSRADNFASEAQDLLEENDFQHAEAPIKAALRLRPHDARYLRLAARLYSEERNPAATTYYDALFRLPEATDTDRLEFAEFAIKLRRPEIALPVIKEMLARPEVSARAYFHAAMLEESARRLPRAIELSRKAVAKESDTSDYSFLLAKLLMESGGTNLTEAKQILFGIGATNRPARIPALRMLSLMQLSPGELQQLVRWLKTVSLPTLEDIFLGYEIIYRANPAQIEQIGREAGNRFTTGRPEEQVALGNWLNGHRLFNQTLLSLKPDPKLRPYVSSVYLDALIGAEKWNDALEFLKKAEAAGAKEFALKGYARLSTNAPTAQAAKTALLRTEQTDSAKSPSQ